MYRDRHEGTARVRSGLWEGGNMGTARDMEGKTGRSIASAESFHPLRCVKSCYINNIISHLHNFGKYAHPQLTKYLHNNQP
jgi:hypothetical protein